MVFGLILIIGGIWSIQLKEMQKADPVIDGNSLEVQKSQDLTNFTLKHTLRQNADEKTILDKLCFKLDRATESFAWNKYSQDTLGIKNYKIENFGEISNSYSSWLEKPKTWILTDLDTQKKYNLSQKWVFEGVYGDILDSQVEAKFVDVGAGNYMMEKESFVKDWSKQKITEYDQNAKYLQTKIAHKYYYSCLELKPTI